MVFIIFLLFALNSLSYSGEYKGFAKLNPEECVPLSKEVVATQLPTEWHKYADFIKICNLKQKRESSAQVSIISIWLKDYYESRFPGDVPFIKDKPSPPLPIIVSKDFQKIGILPKPYPFFEVIDPDIYYGKWKSEIPEEIRIDVNNPAVDGDYYYSPLKWNARNGRYEMKDMDPKYGKRLK